MDTTSRPLNQISDLLKDIRTEKKIVANELKDKDFKSVLEVGCQWGESLKAINDAFPNKYLVGVDRSQMELDKVRTMLDNIYLVCADANKLPFSDESFDVVFTSALFCMVSPYQFENMLDEIIRVAKRYIYMVELDVPQSVDMVDRDRLAANWVAHFKTRGYEATKRKITTEEWDCRPWQPYGFLVSVDKHNMDLTRKYEKTKGN